MAICRFCDRVRLTRPYSSRMGDGALKNTLFHFTRWFSTKSIRKIVYDRNQNNRLKLITRAHWCADSHGTVHTGSDFYSLEWEMKNQIIIALATHNQPLKAMLVTRAAQRHR